MGFGILLFGYTAVIGTLPSALIYGNYLMIIAAFTSLLIIYSMKLLWQYNLYFKISFFISIAYSIVLFASVPFEMMEFSEEVINIYFHLSKVLRFGILFSFHNFLIHAVMKLANEVENKKILKTARRNLYINYIFFILTAVTFVPNLEKALSITAMIFGILVCILNFGMIYSCYMRITYEGHDDEIERKYQEIMAKKEIKKGIQTKNRK